MKAPPGNDTHLSPQGELTIPCGSCASHRRQPDSRDTPRG